MSYYRNEPKEARDLTLVGQKRRLKGLEQRLQTGAIPYERQVRLDEVVDAIERLRSGIPTDAVDVLTAKPFAFVFPKKTPYRLRIPYDYEASVKNLFATIGAEVTRAQIDKKQWQTWLLLKIHSRRYREKEIDEAGARELRFARLFDYRALLESTAVTIQRGVECQYPEIVELRALVAAGENKKEKMLRDRIYAPIPPTPEALLRARVASYDQKSRDIVAALKSKVPKTRLCPYCNMVVGERGHEFEHIVPVARGGLSAEDNMIWVCYDCNRLKRDMALLEFAKVAGFPIEPLIDRLHRMGKKY